MGRGYGRSVMAMAPTLPEGAVRHPWSDGFAWALPSQPPRTLTPEQKDAFDRDGFVVVPAIADAPPLAALVAELDALEAKVERFLSAQDGERFDIAEAGAITFTVHAVLRSEAARAFAPNPMLLGMAGGLLR